VWQRDASRWALCNETGGQFITAMARIIGDPIGTSFGASIWIFRSAPVRATKSSGVFTTADESQAFHALGGGEAPNAGEGASWCHLGAVLKGG